MSRRSFKCSVAMVLFCGGVGWILAQGIAWAVPCNKKTMKAAQHCDAGYDSAGYCSARTGPATNCEGNPGAEGQPQTSGPSRCPGCNDPGQDNMNHCELLKEDVEELRIFDNFTRGREENLSEALKNPRVNIFKLGGELMHRDILDAAMKGIDGVFHFAALWLLHFHE